MSVTWWHRYANCDSTSDPIFFPPDGRVSEERAAEEAEAKYCRNCPVRVVCLEDAISNKSVGIWAGTTFELRQKLSKKRNRKKCPGCKNQTLASTIGFAFCTACGLSWKLEIDETDGSENSSEQPTESADV